MSDDPMVSVILPAVRALAASGALPRSLAQRTLTADTAIDDLGLDSLATLTLLSEIEERADLMLSEAEIVGLRTLGDLARLLVERAKP